LEQEGCILKKNTAEKKLKPFSESRIIHIRPKSEKEYKELIAANPIMMVEFSTEWCPGCIRQKAIFDASGDMLTEYLPDMKLYHIDTDEDSLGISNSLKIQYIPTIVVYLHGRPHKMESGARSMREIIEFVKEKQNKKNK
jgi:thioredoxin-like negative regulator of GroEL